MVPSATSRVKLGAWLTGLLLVLPVGSRAGQGGFQQSPPEISPIERDGNMIHTTLPKLRDAHGLALLLRDDRAARRIHKILREWQRDYRPLLTTDPVLKKIDRRMDELFARSLAGRSHPTSECIRTVQAAPQDMLRPTQVKWLRSLFFDRGVAFPGDLKRLGKEDLADLCLQARALDTLKGLSTWRYRYLAWRYRDSAIKQMFADRDERVAFLTPVHLQAGEAGQSTAGDLRRYLAMLRNLKLQVIRDRTMPYDRFRTLEGLLRGLRYMETIRRASRLTGMDHLLMTRLFIQESEFIHHRVSLAGAFSLAQFLNIALKDIWLFRSRIPGAGTLLKGIKGWEQLKARVVADPRWAIKASCLYMRRLRDEVISRLGSKGSRADRTTVDLLTVEMFLLRKGLMEQAGMDSFVALGRAWPSREMVLFPLLPLGGGVVPDAASLLSGWIERTIRELTRVQISESVFQGRLGRLHAALGLSAYNAGMSNLIKAARSKRPLSALSFPLQITENRNYVDDILDGTDILEDLDRLASGVMRLDYPGLIKLARKACRRTGESFQESNQK